MKCSISCDRPPTGRQGTTIKAITLNIQSFPESGGISYRAAFEKKWLPGQGSNCSCRKCQPPPSLRDVPCWPAEYLFWNNSSRFRHPIQPDCFSHHGKWSVVRFPKSRRFRKSPPIKKACPHCECGSGGTKTAVRMVTFSQFFLSKRCRWSHRFSPPPSTRPAAGHRCLTAMGREMR